MFSRFRDVLRVRSFRFSAATCGVDALAGRVTHMLLIALIPLVSPGRILAYSGGALVIGLPPVILAPVIGVLADRWDRRRILAGASFIQTGLLLLAPLLFVTTRSLAPAWAVLFLYFVCDAFKNTTTPSLLPRLVAPGQIVTANSVWFTLSRVGTLVGMVGGGYLVAALGWPLSFGLDAGLRLATGLLVLGIAALPPAGTAIQPSPGAIGSSLGRGVRRFGSELREVLRLIIRNRYVAFVMFSILVSYSVTGVAYTLLAFIIQQQLGLGTAGVGIYTGIMALGMLAGAVSVGFVGDRLPQTRVIVLGCILTGVLFLVGPWLINIWFLGIVALVSGYAFSWIGIAQNAVLQTRVAPGIQGRIFATREFFSNVAFLGTTVVIGLVSLVAALKALMLITGGVLLGFAAIGWLLVRRFPDRNPAHD